MAAAPEPLALLILRVRVEPEFESAPLRVEVVRVRGLLDQEPKQSSATVHSVDEACEVVRAWLNDFMAGAGPGAA
jgi:hypothetical protein